MGIIVFIVVIILIIVSTARKNGTGTNRSKGQNPPERKQAAASNGSAHGQSGYKRPGHPSGASRHDSSAYQKSAEEARKKKAEAARKHMTEKWYEEESLRKEGRPEHVWEAAGVEEGDGVILASAKLTSYAAEKDNEENSQEDLLGPVYDLMVKGPDTSIAFERDFLAEGMDMLNKHN